MACLALLTVSAAQAFAEEQPDPTYVDRLCGDSRYSTMNEILDETYAKKSDNVAIVATGEKFADALAGSGLAGLHDAPILITESTYLGSETTAALKKLAIHDVIMLGSVDSISSTVEQEIASMISGEITRIYGSNRYETADAIFASSSDLWGTTAIIARGAQPADALSIASYAYSGHAPVFLADSSGAISKSAKEALSSGAFERVLICGDKSAVAGDTQAWCENRGLTVKRFAGADRYETNEKIVTWLTTEEGRTWEGAIVTAGREGKWADALCASSLVAKRNTVLLLADDGCTGTITGPLHDNALPVIQATVLGAEASVSAAVYNTVKGAIAKEWIVERTWVPNIQTLWVEESREVASTDLYSAIAIASGSQVWKDSYKDFIVEEGYRCDNCALKVPYTEIKSKNPDIQHFASRGAVETHIKQDHRAESVSAQYLDSYRVVATGSTALEPFGGHYEKQDTGGWEVTSAYYSLLPNSNPTMKWVEDTEWRSSIEQIWVSDPKITRTWLCLCGSCRFICPAEDHDSVFKKHSAAGCYTPADFIPEQKTVSTGFWKSVDSGYLVVTGGHWA